MPAIATELRRGWDAFWRLYRSGAWEPDTRAVLEGILLPGDLFVDVGAWIGPVTLWALELGADVVAIEPDPLAAAELRRVAPEAEIWPCAVAPTLGALHLAANPKMGGEYGDSMSRIAGQGIEVRALPLSTILGDRTPALVKIDVEGYEATLWPHLKPWLRARRIPCQVSFHDPPENVVYRWSYLERS